MKSRKPHINSKQMASLQRVFNSNIGMPALQSLLQVLPNPDPILRKAGKSSEVYDFIMADAHVIGEVRTLRAGALAFNAELAPGGDDAISQKSFEMAKRFFAEKPMPNTEWDDVDWHNYSAMLRGFSALNLGPFEKKEGTWLPTSIKPWDDKQLGFDTDHNLLIKTRENPFGEITDPRRWTCVRHMPKPRNPYGIALLSSCFWPWTFKQGGFSAFARLTERFGIPFPVGKHASDAEESEITSLLDGLVQLIEDGLAAIPDDTSIDIIESKITGEPLPKQQIDLCNKEMSKALTSQTLATEQQSKSGGARAASETGAKRASENQRADRKMITNARNQILCSIHQVNFNGGEPPIYRFIDKRDINTETTSRVRETARTVQVPLHWAYEQLGAPMPKDGEPVLEIKDEGKGIATPAKTSEFSASANESEWDAFDEATSQEIKKIWAFAQKSDSIQDLQNHIQSSFPGITAGPLAEVTKLALEQQVLQGIDEANNNPDKELKR